LLLILSCEKKTSEIRSYPTDALTDQFETKKFDLDTTKLDFKGITNWIGENDWDDNISLIEIQDGNILKQIYPHTFSGCFFNHKNIIYLTSDSILKNEGYPIKKLKPILAEHYKGIKHNYPYSKSQQFALVAVTIDTNQTASELNDFLIKITRTFDEINSEQKDSLELRLVFDFFRQIPPPPPPPNLNEIDFEE